MCRERNQEETIKAEDKELKIIMKRRTYAQQLEWWAEEFLKTLESHVENHGHLRKYYIRSAVTFWRIQLARMMARERNKLKEEKRNG